MKCFILLLGIALHSSSAVIHSWKAFLTASTGLSDFPEFVALNLVDDELMGYFDTKTNRFEGKQSWVEEKLGQQYVEQESNILRGTSQSFKANVGIAMERFNQTKGVHVLQQMYGCELGDDGITRGDFQIGYDGADFLSLDKSTLTWTAANQKAVITKLKWDATGANANFQKNYLENTCIEWLKKYVNYGKDTLERKVPPSVSLLQKTPSSPVTCHATGFYPSDVMVSWQKDGQDHHEDVEYGEILPNDDGTFQKSSHLTVTSEDRKNSKYQCLVQVKGFKEDFIKVLPDQDAPNFVPIIGGVVALFLVIVAVVVGVVIWKKKSKKGFVPASTSDTSSENSGRAAQMT